MRKGSVMSKKGFTLIEILGVIAIIEMLLAILIPALQIAKQQASGAVCLSNLAGLAKAWHIYADGNNSRIVGGTTSLNPYDEWSPGKPAYAWVCSPQTKTGQDLSGVGSTVDEELIGVRKGLLYPYVEADKVYHCPGDRRFTDPPAYDSNNDGVPDYTGDGGYRTYSIAGGMFGVNPNGSEWWKIIPHTSLAEIKSPGDKYVFLEEMDGRSYNMGSWVVWPLELGIEEWIDPLAIWHNEKSTLGYADGHAEKHIWRDQVTIDMAESQSFYVLAPDSEDLRYMQKNYAYERIFP